jgi:hypothetical protein
MINGEKSLEERILDCWHVVDELDCLYESILESYSDVTKDQIANVISGLHQQYQWKFAKLFQAYENTLSKPSTRTGDTGAW